MFPLLTKLCKELYMGDPLITVIPNRAPDEVYYVESSTRYNANSGGPTFPAWVVRFRRENNYAAKDPNKPTHYYFPVKKYGDALAKKLAELSLRDKRQYCPTTAPKSEIAGIPFPASGENMPNVDKDALFKQFNESEIGKSYIGITLSADKKKLWITAHATEGNTRVRKVICFSDFDSEDAAYEYAKQYRNRSIVEHFKDPMKWVSKKTPFADVYKFKDLVHIETNRAATKIACRVPLDDHVQLINFSSTLYGMKGAIALALAAKEKGQYLNSQEQRRVLGISKENTLDHIESCIKEMYKKIDTSAVITPVTKEHTQIIPKKEAEYSVANIVFDGCDDIVAEYLKQGKRILCSFDKTFEKLGYIIGYNSKSQEPYVTEGDLPNWKHAIPVRCCIKIIGAPEIIRWCEQNGYTITSKGYEHPEKLPFLFEMFQYCGKKMSLEAKEYKWEKEWTEKLF